jgi:hypothetical protein
MSFLPDMCSTNSAAADSPIRQVAEAAEAAQEAAADAVDALYQVEANPLARGFPAGLKPGAVSSAAGLGCGHRAGVLLVVRRRDAPRAGQQEHPASVRHRRQRARCLQPHPHMQARASRSSFRCLNCREYGVPCRNRCGELASPRVGVFRGARRPPGGGVAEPAARRPDGPLQHALGQRVLLAVSAAVAALAVLYAGRP